MTRKISKKKFGRGKSRKT